MMQTQWYLCEIEKYPKHEGDELKKTDNLSVKYPEIFVGGITALLMGDPVEANKEGEGQWYVWLPIIPRVGDTLQFAGWQVQVSKVVLETDWISKTGIKEGLFVSAIISIRDDVIPFLTDSQFAIEALDNKSHRWENYARRGHDLQYYAWELRHESYVQDTRDTGEVVYYRWHTRIRPIAGDVIAVKNNRWRVKSVELASANASVDGWLDLEAIV
jgi:hypothetical protein